MKKYIKSLQGLMWLYLMIFVIYTVLRIVFIIYNWSDFDATVPFTFAKVLVSGWRFDLSAIMLSNLVFTLLWILPIGKYWTAKPYQLLLKLLFLGVNSFFILLNAIDIVYYPFVKKRMQRDALLFFNGEKGNESYTILPVFIAQFWYIWLIMFASIFFLFKYHKVILKSVNGNFIKISWAYFLFFIVVMGMQMIGVRGGLQLRPLAVIDASQSTGVKNIPFVLNSTFSMMRTWSKKSLEAKQYFDQSEITGCDSPIKEIKSDSIHTRMGENIVIIMVESLSKEYLSWYKGTGHTPFLDSLMGHSLVFDNGFANARESVQGIPAVLASIPAWVDEPFIFSKYGTNKFNSIASITKPYGYQSYFHHGSARGTMGFLSFSNLAAFDRYYGREDYPDQSHFDGSWGIWDHHYLPYVARDLSSKPTPFVSTILTINTHHPFNIPNSYKVPYPDTQHPILNTLQYTDYSLKLFFDYAATQSWFKNTIFVITADHTGPMTVATKSTLEDYQVPIIFYRSDNSLRGISATIINQIDIMPTLLSMIGIEETIYSHGKNIFDNTCKNAHIDYRSGIYQYADEQYCIQFDGMQTIGIFEWQKDRLLSANLIADKTLQDRINAMETQLKKAIQSYIHAMIHDEMVSDKE